jgi:hypothetical protein
MRQNGREKELVYWFSSRRCVGDEFARDCLGRFNSAWDFLRQEQEIWEQWDLLESALRAAAYFRFTEILVELVNRCIQLSDSDRGEDTLSAVVRLADALIRALDRLGMSECLEAFLNWLSSLRQEIQDRPTAAGTQLEQTILRLRLMIERGRYVLGHEDSDEPLYSATQRLLSGRRLGDRERLSLTSAYVQALGRGPLAVARPHLGQLFQTDGFRDQLTTASFFRLTLVVVIEALVLAIIDRHAPGGATVVHNRTRPIRGE